MNHTIGKAHDERFVERKSLQPSASAVTDRSLTVDPAGNRRSCAAAAPQAAPPKRSPDHPLPKTNSSVPRPPPPPTPEEDPDVLRQKAASALSRAVEWSRTEARKKSRASSKAPNYIRKHVDLSAEEPFDANAVMEKDVVIECINRLRTAFSKPGEPIPRDFQFTDPNEPWNTLRNILPPCNLEVQHVRMIAESIKKDWNKEAEGRAKETARTHAEVPTADAQQRPTEPSPVVRTQPDSAHLAASTRGRSRGPA